MESFFSFTFTWVLGIELRVQAYTENVFFVCFVFPIEQSPQPFHETS